MPGGGLGSQEEVYRSVFPVKSSCSRRAARQKASEPEPELHLESFRAGFSLIDASQLFLSDSGSVVFSGAQLQI